MKRIDTLFLFLFIMPCVLQAQIQRIMTSPSEISSLVPGILEVSKINTKSIVYTPPTISEVPIPIDGDTVTAIDKVYRYADVITADITMKDGNITSTKSGKVWTLRVNVVNSLSIRLLFDSFDLSSNAEMYVFNDERTKIDSRLTKSKFTFSSSVGLAPMSGNSIVIYILESGNFGAFQSKINIQNIEAGYRPIMDVGGDNIYSEKVDSVQSLSAGVNCIQSVRCQSSKMKYARAVALFRVNGSQGTGTMINNELSSGTPFFLTAFHVIDKNNNGILDPSEIAALATAEFQFQFWRNHCSGSTEDYGIHFSGAVLRAQSNTTDVVLLELLNPPGIGDLVNYAGWNRQSSTPTGYNPFVIHHPLGRDMRITSVSSVGNWLPNNNYWVAYYNSGVVDRGSSGSALMNPDGQIIGQLTGGWSSCDFTDFGDHYGKFNKSWSYAGLQSWLSPVYNRNVTSLLDLTDIPIYGPDVVACTTPAQYTTLSNLSDVTYTWSVNGLQILSGQGSSSVTVSGLPGSPYGSGILTLTLNSPSKGWERTYVVSKGITINTGGSGSISGTYNSPASSTEPLVRTPPRDLEFANAACLALFTSLSVPSGSTVTWSGSADSGVTWYQVGNDVFCNFTALNQVANLSVTISNSCGSTSENFRFRCMSLNTCGIQPL